MRTAIEFYALLTVAANIAVIGALGFVVVSRVSPRARGHLGELRAWLTPTALPLAWVVAAGATAGSLTLSEVAGYPPCELCWYQRIAMYPLVVILGVAVLRRDLGIRRYVVPLVTGGASISIYHYLSQRFPSAGGVCDAAVPCTFTWVWKYHYISIPFMALSAFALIATLLLLARTPAGRDREAADDGIPEEVLV